MLMDFKRKHCIIELSYSLAHTAAGLTTHGILCSVLAPYFQRENDKVEHMQESVPHDKWWEKRVIYNPPLGEAGELPA